jgi:hypothetical protein
MLLEGSVWEIAQYISLFLIIFGLYYTIKRTIMNKQWAMDIPMILLFVHGFIYYMFLFITRILNLDVDEKMVFTIWSIFLRMHGYGTLLILAYANYIKEKRKYG